MYLVRNIGNSIEVYWKTSKIIHDMEELKKTFNFVVYNKYIPLKQQSYQYTCSNYPVADYILLTMGSEVLEHSYFNNTKKKL